MFQSVFAMLYSHDTDMWNEYNAQESRNTDDSLCWGTKLLLPSWLLGFSTRGEREAQFCLTLIILRYVSRVKWSHLGKRVAPQCSSYLKGNLRVAFDNGHQLWLYIYIYIYIYIYSYLSFHMVDSPNKNERERERERERDNNYFDNNY